jgi:hypothetical protein
VLLCGPPTSSSRQPAGRGALDVADTDADASMILPLAPQPCQPGVALCMWLLRCAAITPAIFTHGFPMLP